MTQRLPMAACLLLGAVVLAAMAACAPTPTPVGTRTPGIDSLVAHGWRSSDTLIRIDPATFAEEVIVTEADRSPDTLASGLVVYEIAEYMPVFAGCEADPDPALCTQQALSAEVRERLVYPRSALVRSVQGSGVATFVVGADGRVRDTGVERSLGDELDGAVLDLIGRLPMWHPGFHDGQPVAVRYRLPVTFSLPEG